MGHLYPSQQTQVYLLCYQPLKDGKQSDVWQKRITQKCPNLGKATKGSNPGPWC